MNLSGVIAEQNRPGMAAYGASKAAVRAFDQALPREARGARIRVLDARPPHTETGLADRSRAWRQECQPGYRPSVLRSPFVMPSRPVPPTYRAAASEVAR